MKKLLLLLLILTAFKTHSQQQIDRIDTCSFVTGVPSVPNDSTRWFNLQNKYSYVYVTVQDTDGAAGTHYTDSIKCYAVTKRLSAADSVLTPLTMRRVDAGNYTDYSSSSANGVTSEYLLVNAYIDRLYLVWSNQQFISGRKCKITVRSVARF